MKWARFGWLVAAAAIGAGAMTAFGACSSFSAAADPDAGPDVADTAPPACTLPSAPVRTGYDDTSAMVAPKLGDVMFDDAVVASGKLFGRTVDGGIVTGDPSAPTVFAPTSPFGVSKGMTVDPKYLYVATDAGLLSYELALSSSTTTKTSPDGGTSFDNGMFGTSSFYAWDKNGVAKWSLSADDLSAPNVYSQQNTAGAVEGDDAYFTSPASGSGTDAPVTKVGTSGTIGYLVDPVTALAVSNGIAFGATISENKSHISRVTLGPSAPHSTEIITEFGLVQRLFVLAGRLYWLAMRGPDGVVLASSDFCGGGYQLHATQLPATTVTLSFDDQYIYAAGGHEVLRRIMR